MILITKQEAEIVRKKFPGAEITRTCKQDSKRHRYYLPEKVAYLRLIQKYNEKAAAILKGKQNQHDMFY